MSATDDDLPPSKTQRKRAALDLKNLGQQLVTLNAAQLALLPLRETVRDAVLAAHSITQHGARKRHIQYIGRLLRAEDAQPLRIALQQFIDDGRAAFIRERQCDLWQERLLSEGDAAIAALLEVHPSAERQRLRQLVRAAHNALPAKADQTRNALLCYLRELSQISH